MGVVVLLGKSSTSIQNIGKVFHKGNNNQHLNYQFVNCLCLFIIFSFSNYIFHFTFKNCIWRKCAYMIHNYIHIICDKKLSFGRRPHMIIYPQYMILPNMISINDLRKSASDFMSENYFFVQASKFSRWD